MTSSIVTLKSTKQIKIQARSGDMSKAENYRNTTNERSGFTGKFSREPNNGTATDGGQWPSPAHRHTPCYRHHGARTTEHRNLWTQPQVTLHLRGTPTTQPQIFCLPRFFFHSSTKELLNLSVSSNLIQGNPSPYDAERCYPLGRSRTRSYSLYGVTLHQTDA